MTVADYHYNDDGDDGHHRDYKHFAVIMVVRSMTTMMSPMMVDIARVLIELMVVRR